MPAFSCLRMPSHTVSCLIHPLLRHAALVSVEMLPVTIPTCSKPALHSTITSICLPIIGGASRRACPSCSCSADAPSPHQQRSPARLAQPTADALLTSEALLRTQVCRSARAVYPYISGYLRCRRYPLPSSPFTLDVTSMRGIWLSAHFNRESAHTPRILRLHASVMLKTACNLERTRRFSTPCPPVAGVTLGTQRASKPSIFATGGAQPLARLIPP